MLEAKLLLKVHRLLSWENPFYGQHTTCIKQEVIHDCEHDYRDDIAPVGIAFSFEVENDEIEVKIDRHFLDSRDENRYTAIFSYEDNVFELSVTFDCVGGVEDISVNHYLGHADFADGEVYQCYTADNLKRFDTFYTD